MRPVSDYHMHTPLCGHAVGQPEEYVQKAIQEGLSEMGFSDHAPFVHMVDPKITMSKDQLPEYHSMIEDVQRRFADQINIKIALEVDFIPKYEAQTRAICEGYAYDYLIGSVHFIRDWAFDDPAARYTWTQKDVNQVYRDYYDLLRQSALCGMFDIIGHCDLVKKFGHRATDDMSKDIHETAEVFKETGMAIEINTAGLRKPVGEMYPSLEALKIYNQHGIILTFGSDAHRPEDVAAGFDDAFLLAKAAGYKEYYIFKQRQIEWVEPVDC